MTTIFTTYIARQVLLSVAIVLLALVGIGALFDFISQLKHLDKAHVSYQDVLLVVVYAVPSSMYETFPPAVLIGSLLALGGMASKSELIAMRAAGVSKYQITGMVALTGIILMVFIAFIGEALLPVSESHRDMLKDKIKGRVVSEGLADVWLKENQEFIHIKKVIDAETLQGVTVYKLLNGVVKQQYFAEKAELINEKWYLIDASEQIYKGDAVSLSNNMKLSFDWQFNLELLKVLDEQSSTLSVSSLYEYVNYMEDNQLDSSRYRLSFWLKLLSPLTVMVMLMLAIPFAFGSLRTMAAGNLIVVGLVIGLIYYIVSGIASNLGHLYGLPPFINAFAPSFIFVLLALLLMIKQKF